MAAAEARTNGGAQKQRRAEAEARVTRKAEGREAVASAAAAPSQTLSHRRTSSQPPESERACTPPRGARSTPRAHRAGLSAATAGEKYLPRGRTRSASAQGGREVRVNLGEWWVGIDGALLRRAGDG